MKKIILSILTGAIIVSANSDTTVDATMSLMEKGKNDIQKGFLYNDKALIKEGISIVKDANNIFGTVDVKSFLNNDKTQVVSNIHKNISKSLKSLEKSINNKEYAKASNQFGKVLNDCVSCHTVIRRW